MCVLNDRLFTAITSLNVISDCVDRTGLISFAASLSQDWKTKQLEIARANPVARLDLNTARHLARKCRKIETQNSSKSRAQVSQDWNTKQLEIARASLSQDGTIKQPEVHLSVSQRCDAIVCA